MDYRKLVGAITFFTLAVGALGVVGVFSRVMPDAGSLDWALFLSISSMLLAFFATPALYMFDEDGRTITKVSYLRFLAIFVTYFLFVFIGSYISILGTYALIAFFGLVQLMTLPSTIRQTSKMRETPDPLVSEEACRRRSYPYSGSTGGGTTDT